MNTNQKRILIAVILLVGGMLLHPPFQRVASNGATYNMGYGWIFDPPGRDATVNVAILLMQWIGVLVVGGLGFFLAKGANPSTNSQGPIGVGGWLLLLVAGMLAIGPLLGAARVGSAMYFVEAQFPALKTMGEWGSYKTVMWLAFLVFAALSVYGGWGLLRGKDWSAVGRAKTVLWLVGPGGSLVLGVLIPKMTLSESNIDGGFVGGFIASVLSAAIWTAYLSKSKRVRNTYGGKNALAGTSTKNAAIIATAPPTTSWQNSGPSPGVPATSEPSQASPDFTPPYTATSQQRHSAQVANATTQSPPPTPIQPPTSFAVDEDAVYATVAAELESGNTDKGLWIRIYAECDGDEQKTKICYIRQRAERLLAIERARLEELERLRLQQEELIERKKMVRDAAIERIRVDEEIRRLAEQHRDDPRLSIDEKANLLRLVRGDFKWLGSGGQCSASFLEDEKCFLSGEDFANWFSSEVVPTLLAIEPHISTSDSKPAGDSASSGEATVIAVAEADGYRLSTAIVLIAFVGIPLFIVFNLATDSTPTKPAPCTHHGQCADGYWCDRGTCTPFPHKPAK